MKKKIKFVLIIGTIFGFGYFLLYVIVLNSFKDSWLKSGRSYEVSVDQDLSGDFSLTNGNTTSPQLHILKTTASGQLQLQFSKDHVWSGDAKSLKFSISKGILNENATTLSAPAFFLSNDAIGIKGVQHFNDWVAANQLRWVFRTLFSTKKAENLKMTFQFPNKIIFSGQHDSVAADLLKKETFVSGEYVLLFWPFYEKTLKVQIKENYRGGAMLSSQQMTNAKFHIVEVNTRASENIPSGLEWSNFENQEMPDLVNEELLRIKAFQYEPKTVWATFLKNEKNSETDQKLIAMLTFRFGEFEKSIKQLLARRKAKLRPKLIHILSKVNENFTDKLIIHELDSEKDTQAKISLINLLAFSKKLTQEKVNFFKRTAPPLESALNDRFARTFWLLKGYIVYRMNSPEGAALIQNLTGQLSLKNFRRTSLILDIIGNSGSSEYFGQLKELFLATDDALIKEKAVYATRLMNAPEVERFQISVLKDNEDGWKWCQSAWKARLQQASLSQELLREIRMVVKQKKFSEEFTSWVISL